MVPWIEIVPYNPEWPAEFRRLATPLRDAFGSLALRIDHIGSTSVPGLAAKDVIDLQITVAKLDASQIAASLLDLGYGVNQRIAGDHIPPGQSSEPGDWAKVILVAPVEQRRTNVHVRVAGKPNQRYPILFRDYLRSNPSASESYRLIKVAMAELHPEDMDAYYDGKDPVCDLIIESAELWAGNVGWSLGASDA